MPANTRLCSVAGCEDPPRSRAMCGRHYARAWRLGALGPVRPTKPRVAVIGEGMLEDALDITLTIGGYRVYRVPRLAVFGGRRPTVVVVDLDQHDSGGVQELARRGIPVVGIGDALPDAAQGRALLDGVRVIVDKADTLRSLTSVVRRIAGGQAVLAAGEYQRLVDAWRLSLTPAASEPARLDGLTRREREVLDHLVAGMKVADIAALHVVSEHTVRSQIKAILAKLGVTSQHAAVSVALRATAGLEVAA